MTTRARAFGRRRAFFASVFKSGASRVCFAVGQTSSPVVCAVLYVIHPSFAIGSMFLAVTTVPIAFYLCGQSFFVDPAVQEGSEAPPNVAA